MCVRKVFVSLSITLMKKQKIEIFWVNLSVFHTHHQIQFHRRKAKLYNPYIQRGRTTNSEIGPVADQIYEMSI